MPRIGPLFLSCQNSRGNHMALSKRQRAKAFRGVQYGILVVIVIVIAFVADWGTIKRAFFDFEVMSKLFPDVIFIALKNTIVYTALGFAVGLLLGLVLALMKLSPVPPYRWIATIYIEFFRGIPALLVFIAFNFGIPLAFQVRFDNLTTVTIALAWRRRSARASRRCPRARSRPRARSACPRAAPWPRSSSRRRSGSSCRR
jgi:His/Glu/Gln/Arg/opine family amino acid ABC transporter permease subunit